MAAYKVKNRWHSEDCYIQFWGRFDAKRWPLVTLYGYKGPMVEYQAQKIGRDVWVWVKVDKITGGYQLLKRVPFNGAEDDFAGIHKAACEILRV